MGFKTVAIARGSDKERLARQLGAWHYIDSQAQDPVVELIKRGGAKVILATATSGKALGAVLGGLRVDAKMVIVGTADPVKVPALLLIRDAVRSWAGHRVARSIRKIHCTTAR